MEQHGIVPKIYTSQEVAEILRVHEMTIRRYIKMGKIRPINTDGAIRISETELKRFINGEE